MEAIQTPLILTSLRTRVDKSIGISATLPFEPSPQEVIKLIELLNINLIGYFKPADVTPDGVHTLVVPQKTTKQGKQTQSQRIRQLLYLCFTRGIDTLDGENEDDYYHRQTEKIITKLKEKLETTESV